jgi:hypothetical protein
MRYITPLLIVALAIGLNIAGPDMARAAPQSYPVALFKGLDKITGEVHSFHVFMDETVQFGALRITPRICYDRPPTEPEKTTVFLEVDELTLDRKVRRIFSGWMLAQSPGLNGVDHPVYDVWLTDCSTKAPETP